jgi:hypothetical protein
MYWDGHGWAAPPQAPVATKKSSSGGKVALVVVGIFVLLFAIGKCGSSDDKTSSSSSSSSTTASRPSGAPSATPAEPATPTAAPAGSPVRDGKFEFRVLGMTRAAQAGDLSNQFVDAQGEFIILTMSVANIGDQAQSYFGTNQKLIDTAGREYEANSTADMWANKGTGDINPGNSIQVRAAFDVPPGTQPAELEVHDSMFSGGAKVRL